MEPQPDNPKGFWERNDVYELDDNILKTMGADWHKVAHLDLDTLGEEERRVFERKARVIIQNLDAHRPWVMKDPRMCLLLPLWQPLLEIPICVYSYRSPLQVAQSLRARNGFPIHFGAALWEKYNLAALANSRNLPRLFVSHQRLLGQPLETVRALYAQLLALNVQGLRLPSEREIRSFLDPALYRERGDASLEKEFITGAQAEFFQALEEGTSSFFDGALSLSAGTRAVLENHDLEEERERQRRLVGDTLQTKESELLALHQKVTELEQQRMVLEQSKAVEGKAWQQQLAEAEQQRAVDMRTLQQQLTEVEQRRVALEESKAAEGNAWQQRLAEAEQQRVTLEQGKAAEGKAWQQRLAEVLRQRAVDVQTLQQQINEIQLQIRNTAQLVRWIEQLEQGIGSIFQSQRWKLGHMVSALTRKLRFKPPLLSPQNFLNEIFTKFHAWRIDADKQKKSPTSAPPAVPPPAPAVPVATPPVAAPPAAPTSLAIPAVAQPVAFAPPVVPLPAPAVPVAARPVVPAPPAVPPPAPAVPAAAQSAQVRHFDTLALPEHRNPVVSIIIPVHNQWEYTYGCVKAIIEHTQRIPYEIIIADDVSTDETRELTRYVKNVVWVRNAKQLGFTLNCNNAARQAKGEYLLLLNNDTTVRAEWLDAMLETMRKDDKVGLVGAKLVYPNGKLQEAGGIIWSDASGRNYGKQEDPENPEYNYVKEVDYCSGACILLRTSLWNALGGFDPRFAPAYYEDPDLAFRIRQLGYKVVYQPKALVVHFEGISHGTNEQEGLKSYQVTNREKFREKWQHVLRRDHLPPGDSVFLARDRAFKKGIVLVIDHRMLTWDKDAGSKATYQYIQLFLDSGHKVVFVPDNFQRLEPYATALQQMGVEVLYWPPYNSSQFVKWLQENGRHIRHVVLNRPNISQKHIGAVKKWTPAPIFYYPMDLHWLRAKNEYDVTKSEEALEQIRYWEKTEHEVIAASDVVLVVSHLEVEVLKQRFPYKDVRYVPLSSYEKVPVEEGAPFAQRSGVLFVGGAAHPPNIDAVQWYVRDIHPLVRTQLPTMSFYVCGERMNEVIQTKDASVKILGHVSDEKLAELYRSVRMVIAPLRYGGGVKGKILEALAHGVPLVTTTVGAQGLPTTGQSLLIADTPAEFAAVLRGVYQDEPAWTTQANAGMRYIQEYFSPTVMRAAFADMLEREEPASAALQIDEVRSYAEYQTYAINKSQEQRRQEVYEKTLIPSEDTFEVAAYCYVCQCPVSLSVDFQYAPTGNGERTPNWRERLVCPRCHLNNRLRASLHLFEEILHPTKESHLYIAEQYGPLYRWLTQKYPHTIGSEYLGDEIARGATNDAGIRNEDLTRLSFPDNQFDCLLSFDVFGHIPNVRQALQECWRVLKPQGSLFFSVPFVKTEEKIIVRATVGSTGEITHLLPAEYHGNPTRADGILAFYHFGWELLDQLREIGFVDARACFYWSAHFGYLGEGQLVLIASKGAADEKPESVPVLVPDIPSAQRFGVSSHAAVHASNDRDS